MTNESDEIKIYVDVINGLTKAQSRVNLTPALEILWDETEAWKRDALTQHPHVVFEVPSEWPDAYEPRS